MALESFLDMSTIAVPTLVVAGGDDRGAPAAQMEELAAAVPGSRFRVLPGAGHLLNLEEPELFGAALSEFLDAVDGGRTQPRAAAYRIGGRPL